MLLFTNIVATGQGISFSFSVINIYYESNEVTFNKYVLQAFLFFNIYLFLAASELSCGTWDLSLWHAGFSLVVAHVLSICGTGA